MMAETCNPSKRAPTPMADVAEKTGDLLRPGEDIRPEIKGLRLMDGGLYAPNTESVGARPWRSPTKTALMVARAKV